MDGDPFDSEDEELLLQPSSHEVSNADGKGLVRETDVTTVDDDGDEDENRSEPSEQEDEDEEPETVVPAPKVDVDKMISQAVEVFGIQTQSFMKGLKSSVEEAVGKKLCPETSDGVKQLPKEKRSKPSKPEEPSFKGVKVAGLVASKPPALPMTAPVAQRPQIQQTSSSNHGTFPDLTLVVKNDATVKLPSEDAISTSTHKNEFMKLQRRFDAKDPQCGPEMWRLWNGTLKDKGVIIV